MLVRIPDGAEIVVKSPDDSPISELRWSEVGTQFGVASENSHCRVLSMN